MNIEIVGINFQTAPIAVRERLAVNADGLLDMLSAIRADTAIPEIVVLSTCNRTEIICAGGSANAAYDWLRNRLATLANLETSAIKPYLYHYTGSQAAKHLFRVVAGLDSMVLGEPQIHGQVKKAYQASQQLGLLGSSLERLFQRSFNVAKKIRSNTGIGQQPVSVAYSAINLAKRLFADLSAHSALLIGAGETSALVGRHLAEHGVKDITVVNRDLERAQNLAAELSGTAHSLNDLIALLPAADLVFTSTGADYTLLDKADFKQALKIRKRRPMFVVDLAVPRDIDAAANELDDVYLYTVDDLSLVIEEGRQTRQAAAEQAELLVKLEVEAFELWQQSLSADDMIRRMREMGDQLRDEAVIRAVKQLNAGQTPEKVVQQLATQLTNKWLHGPIKALRDSASGSVNGSASDSGDMSNSSLSVLGSLRLGSENQESSVSNHNVEHRILSTALDVMFATSTSGLASENNDAHLQATKVTDASEEGASEEGASEDDLSKKGLSNQNSSSSNVVIDWSKRSLK